MNRVLVTTASMVMTACVGAAGWLLVGDLRGEAAASSYQEELEAELRVKQGFEPVEVELAGHVRWYGPDVELQVFEAEGANEVQETDGVVDPAPKVSKKANKAASKKGEKSRKASKIKGWTPSAARESVSVISGKEGSAWGRISIPKIDLEKVMVAGTSLDALEKGPGVWRHGAAPGKPGNATVSGHRTGWGGPFNRIDELEFGDRIVVTDAEGKRSVYEVRGRAVVKPDEVGVTADAGGVRLTLTTCHPEGSTKFRLVVQAEMIEGEWVDYSQTRSEWDLL